MSLQRFQNNAQSLAKQDGLYSVMRFHQVVILASFLYIRLPAISAHCDPCDGFADHGSEDSINSFWIRGKDPLALGGIPSLGDFNKKPRERNVVIELHRRAPEDGRLKKRVFTTAQLNQRINILEQEIDLFKAVSKLNRDHNYDPHAKNIESQAVKDEVLADHQRYRDHMNHVLEELEAAGPTRKTDAERYRKTTEEYHRTRDRYFRGLFYPGHEQETEASSASSSSPKSQSRPNGIKSISKGVRRPPVGRSRRGRRRKDGI